MTIVYRDDGTPIDPFSCTIEEHATLAATRNRPVTNPPIRRRTPDRATPHDTHTALDTYLKDDT